MRRAGPKRRDIGRRWGMWHAFDAGANERLAEQCLACPCTPPGHSDRLQQFIIWVIVRFVLPGQRLESTTTRGVALMPPRFARPHMHR
eukprot:4008032-Pyramimonas_sp.AAC.1